MNTLQLKIWSEKIPGKGEDASAIARVFEDGSGLVAAFDGLGGSGSTQYELGGVSISGAYFASRVARSLLNTFFTRNKASKDDFSLEETLSDYSELLTLILKKSIEVLDKNPSKLRSKLIRRLPTTLTAIYFEQAGENQLKIWPINAGDSRSYVLRPEQGLQQLTKDDLSNNANALESLYSDSRMSFCLHADCDNKLNYRSLEITGSAVLISATDGCFDYVQFPAHLEYKLLDALMYAGDLLQWQAILGPSFKNIASDDVGMGLIAVGWPDFQTLKEAFKERHQFLKEKYVSPIGDIAKKVEDSEESTEKEVVFAERDKGFQELWAEYGPTYEALMADSEERKQDTPLP